MGCDRTFGEGNPRLGIGQRRNAQAGGVTRRTARLTKNARAPRVFLSCVEVRE
jgi:hypothetical protein